MSGARAVERLRAFGRAALLVLAALLPFEKLEPLARIGPLQLSSVELFLYLALAAWGLALVAGWWAGERDLLERTRAGAARAPRGRGLRPGAAPFGGAGARRRVGRRSSSRSGAWAGCCSTRRPPICCARPGRRRGWRRRWSAVRWPPRCWLSQRRARPRVEALLRSFHLKTFAALGHPRASGPFQYPNIAAMYLEAVAPIAAALGAAALASAIRTDPIWGWPASCWWCSCCSTASWPPPRARDSSAASRRSPRSPFSTAGGGRPGRWRPRCWQPCSCWRRSPRARRWAGRFRFWRDGDWYRAVVTPSGGREGAAAPGARAREHGDREPGDREPGGAPLAARSPLSRGAVVPLARRRHRRHGGARRAAHLPSARSLPGRQRPDSRGRARAGPAGALHPLVGSGARAHHLVQRARQPRAARAGRRRRRGRSGAIAPSPVVGVDRGAARRYRAVAAAPGRAARGLRASRASPCGGRPSLPGARIPCWGSAPTTSGTSPAVPGARAHRRADARQQPLLRDPGRSGDGGPAGVRGAGRALWGAARRAVAAPASRILALGVAAGLATYFLHGLLDYFLEFTPTYALFWLLAGMMVAMDRSPESAA